jgi:hypothetical protein
MVSHKDARFLTNSTISRDRSVQPAHPLSGISPLTLISHILARAAAHTDIPAPPVFTLDTVLDLIGISRAMIQQDAKTPLHESTAESTEAASMILTFGAEALRRASSFPSLGNQSPTQNMNKCVQIATKLCHNLFLLRAAQAGPTTPPPPPTITTATTTTRIIPIITTTIPTSSTTIPDLLHDDITLLKATLPKIDFISWLQHAPEAYVWLCFTAAVAAHCRDEERSSENENDDWTSFILTPMPVITAMDSADLRLMREGWMYLRWLRRNVQQGVEQGTTD